MRKLILIKHAPPMVDPTVSSEQWTLSEKGQALCAPLADAVAAHRPGVIVSSEEPKAAETARLVAERLKISTHPAPGLHEHDRRNVPHMRSGEFISMMELFFRKPEEHVLGKETADQAVRRFTTSLNNVLNGHPQDNVAVVSHGTVIALFLKDRDRRAAFEIWRAMGLPSFAVLSLPEMKLIECVDRIG
jgi:broad specificity phosphatase PhoE